jgi:hypothetical protein
MPHERFIAPGGAVLLQLRPSTWFPEEAAQSDDPPSEGSMTERPIEPFYFNCPNRNSRSCRGCGLISMITIESGSDAGELVTIRSRASTGLAEGVWLTFMRPFRC